jgi:transposase
MKYNHYIALDWAQRNMAVARMTEKSDFPIVTDSKSNLDNLKAYLKSLKGTKILTFEECNAAQWLYTELKSEVDEILVCDPYRNHLLKEGHKSDPIDAGKLCVLLRGKLLKPVFHCTDEFINLRKLVSGYDDLIHSVVQMKNRLSAMYRAKGLKHGERFKTSEEIFVSEELKKSIQLAEDQRSLYEREFKKIRRKHKVVRDLESIPGIGLINSVKLVAIIVDGKRFTNKSPYLVYCGLLKTDAMSGGKKYGRRTPRHSRQLKSIFKTAALACVNSREGNPLKEYYISQTNKKLPECVARHALSRRIAVLALGVMKSGVKLRTENLCVEDNIVAS